jgi:hypothetical protein
MMAKIYAIVGKKRSDQSIIDLLKEKENVDRVLCSELFSLQVNGFYDEITDEEFSLSSVIEDDATIILNKVAVRYRDSREEIAKHNWRVLSIDDIEDLQQLLSLLPDGDVSAFAANLHHQ